MQMKHLIIFALVGMVALLGFNLINGNQRDKDREAVISDAGSEQSPDTALPNTDDVESGSVDVASQPLGKQPKAILDNATAKIDQAQEADKERLDQMSNAQ